MDDGRQLSDEDWSEFFQTQLESLNMESAEDSDASVQEDGDPDDPFSSLPDPFGDDTSLPGVRT